jgi:hypothetical protein
MVGFLNLAQAIRSRTAERPQTDILHAAITCDSLKV